VTSEGAWEAHDAITGLAGVILWTSAERFHALRAFYVDTLGLEPRSDREQFVSFDWGAGDARAPRLTVTVHSAVRGLAKEPLRVMVNIEVGDIEAVHARLRALGVPFLRQPEREHFGGRVATLKDPDGNLLQLLEQPST
jgi:catechol 2,3-dioxygenase-like lactoylglutathione lyase family enzyme